MKGIEIDMKGIKNEPLPSYKEFCEYFKEKGIKHVNGMQFYCDYIYALAFDDWNEILWQQELEETRRAQLLEAKRLTTYIDCETS